MIAPLQIVTTSITSGKGPGLIFDMTKRCAFALCTGGEFIIKILNEEYKVTSGCLFACMPFVNIEVVRVEQPGEILFGFIHVDDLPELLTRWINTQNLLIIQQYPLTQLSDKAFMSITASIDGYLRDYRDVQIEIDEITGNKLQKDIIECHSMLVIGKVLNEFFSTINLEPHGHTHNDIVFQGFMFSLYRNFRIQRTVEYYARRSGLSNKYFSTVVRQISGLSPSKWIERVVVGEAKSMLHEPQRSIKEIASALNFPDAPTFTKYFLRVTGITPKAYRHSLLHK